MTNQEILPPEPVAAAAGGGDGDDPWRDNGKFKAGHPGGTRKGSPNNTTRELREAIMRAFDAVGGESYLIYLAYVRPDLFAGLLGKVLPLKLEPGEDTAMVEYRYIKRTPMKKVAPP